MKFMQQPRAVFMVRPSSFGFNIQTSSSNFFQSSVSSSANVGPAAIAEFERMVGRLRANDIDVVVFDDTSSPQKPDAIFPNNWISLHEDGTAVLYPMMTENRRWERREDILGELKKQFVISKVVDLTAEENAGKFLEGTGSLVFDHTNKIVYASRSPRTSEELVNRVSKLLGYKPIIFSSVDENGNAIYHTNVMMCVGEKFVVLCLDSIKDEDDQERLLESFSSTEHKVIAISFAQTKAFAGNMIEVKTRNNEPVVLLSQTAFDSLLPGQLNAISQFAELLPLEISTIQTVGGGSVRCMIAGIHSPRRNTI
jgi:hypothetical protein